MRYLILSTIVFFIFSGIAVAEPSRLVFGQHRHIKSYASLKVLKAAYAKLDIQVFGRLEPEGRSLVDSSDGLLDGEVHRIEGIGSKFPQLIQVPIPINKHEGVAFSYRDDITIEGWESLNNIRVGRLIGILFSEEGLKNATKVKASSNLNRLFDLLAAGRLDVVVYVREELATQQERYQDQRLHILEPPLSVDFLYHYLHAKHKDLVPRITRVLQQMQKEGEIDEIREQAMKEYGLKYPVE